MGDAVVYAIKKGYRVSQFSPDDGWVEDRPRTTCRRSSLKLTSAYWLRLYLLEWIRNWCCIGKSDWFCCQARGAFYCWKALESFSSTRSSWGTFFKLNLWEFRVSFEIGHFRLRNRRCIDFKYDIKAACDQTMRELGVDYLDMYLMHFPTGFQKVAVGTPGMKDSV